MRQWGSSLNHNGMATIPVVVPSGSLFYHGTQRNREVGPPLGPEWLAFEIEHAENFAISLRYNKSTDPGVTGRSSSISRGPSMGHPDSEGQAVLGSVSEAPVRTSEEAVRGYLHTYRANRDLRLLYIDGMSAGNSELGTLDLGDLVLRLKDDAELMDEYGRANDLCDLIGEWGYDGVIRMEIGFEIIYCDFFSGLDLLDARRRAFVDQPEGRVSQSRDFFRFAAAVARRYDGFDSNRLKLDFSRMVSAHFYPVNLTNPDPDRQELPRLLSTTSAEREAIHSRVVEVHTQAASPDIEWQSITDMIVSRYGDRLALMRSSSADDEVLIEEVYRATNLHFEFPATPNDINAMRGDATRESEARERCAAHYLQPVEPMRDSFTQEDELLHTAIRAVTARICDALFEARAHILRAQLGGDLHVWQPGNSHGKGPLREAVRKARDLIAQLADDLRWSAWKRCRGCAVDEFCFVAMWPLGTPADHYHPGCVDASHFERVFENNYWIPNIFDGM